MAKVTFTRWILNHEQRRPISVEPSRVDVVEHFDDARGTKGHPSVMLWWNEDVNNPVHDTIPAASRIVMQGKQEYLVQGTVEEVTAALNAGKRKEVS